MIKKNFFAKNHYVILTIMFFPIITYTASDPYTNFRNAQNKLAIEQNKHVRIDSRQRCIDIAEIFLCHPFSFCSPFNPPKQQLKNHLSRNFRLGQSSIKDYPEHREMAESILEDRGIDIAEPTYNCCSKKTNYQECNEQCAFFGWTSAITAPICTVIDPGCAAITCAASCLALYGQRIAQLAQLEVKHKKASNE